MSAFLAILAVAMGIGILRGMLKAADEGSRAESSYSPAPPEDRGYGLWQVWR